MSHILYETAEVFEAAEALLDPIALRVELGVVDESFAIAFWGAQLAPDKSDRLAQAIAGTGFIGEHGSGLLTFERGGCNVDVMGLSGRDTNSPLRGTAPNPAS